MNEQPATPSPAAPPSPSPAPVVTPPPPAPAPASPVPVFTPSAPAPASAPVPPISTASRLDSSLESIFRFGFAGVFLINSATAIVAPKGFLQLIEANFVGRIIGHYPLQIWAITINDLILGLLIVSGWKQRYVYAWAGMWLLIVTFFKSTSLF